jgi:hypothetical protein
LTSPYLEKGEFMEPLNLNLDGLTPEELVEAATALSTLAAYAKTKARAMQDRASGEIDAALAQEEQCDRNYAKLPAWAKW